MSQYLKKHYSTVETPQTEPIPGSNQVPNSAGGYAWAVDDWARLDRFLILGTEGGSYYASEKKLTKESAEAVQRCIEADGARTVNRIIEISASGRAPKNDPALFALAMCTAAKNEKTRQAAWAALPLVARIGTHLFHFAEYRQAFGGWGRATRNGIRNWYRAKSAEDLAYQAIKYQSRDGWSNRDLLRLSHPKPPTPEHSAVYRWIAKGNLNDEHVAGHRRDVVTELNLPPIIRAFEQIKQMEDNPRGAVNLIMEANLPREAVPTPLLKDPSVWEALLERMPMTAMVRNLGTMSKIGLLTPMSEAEKKVIDVLGNVEQIKKSRIHPIQVLSAMLTYGAGHGVRSDASWKVCQRVVDALDRAFYASFENVQPTGKRILIGLDVSGSMGSGVVAGVPGLTPRIASAALCMVTARVESQYHVMAFAERFLELPISPRQRLDDICKITSRMNFGGTDCALPMKWALQTKTPVDAFLVYTDSETWAGDGHPAQALQEYRRKTGIQAKLVVVGMVANDFTIADPKDGGMLDVVGFDTATPALIEDFVRG